MILFAVDLYRASGDGAVNQQIRGYALEFTIWRFVFEIKLGWVQ